MRRPEQRLWDRMRRALAPAGFVLNRVENLIGVGDPDVEVITLDGRYSKIELKAREEPPARPSTPFLGDKHGLTREQRNFLRRWAEHNGNAYVLIGAGIGHACQQVLVHVPPRDPGLVDEINGLSWTRLRAIAQAESWHGIELALRGV